MSTTSTSIQLTFTVDQVPYRSVSDAILNIKKRREQIRFITSSHNDLVNLAYVQGRPVSSSSNLCISDRSGSIVANRSLGIDSETEFEGKTALVTTKDFFVTDRFSVESSTALAEPLYYKHILNADNFVDDLDIVTSIKILDSSFEDLDVQESLLDKDNRVVYSNLKNSYDEDTGVSVVYFIQYTVRYTTGVVLTFVELLNNQPVFNEATFGDINELGYLDEDCDAYLLNDHGGDYEITFPRDTTWGIKQVEGNKIRILPPVDTSTEDSWYVSVSGGDFYTTIDGTTYHYNIAEFLDQNFSPEPPTRKVNSENSLVASEHLIKLNKENIRIDNSLSLHLRVQVSDVYNNLKLAYSTNPSDIDVVAGVDSDGENVIYVVGINKDPDGEYHTTTGIRSLDATSGFVDILDTLSLDDQVSCSYWYNEENFEFLEFDFNPIRNRDILGSLISIYVKPEVGVELDKTLYYLEVDRRGKIIDTNDTESLIDSVPFDEVIVSSGVYYDSVSSGIIGAKTFVEHFSAEGPNTSNYLILGDITVGQNSSPNDLAIFDTRVRGGGIKDEYVDEVLALDPSWRWTMDLGMNDGQPYPGLGTWFIEIPQSSIDDYDGDFSKVQIRDLVERHMAAGSYPAISYYGIEPNITSIVATTTTLALTWSQENSSAYFRTCHSKNLNGPWTKGSALAPASPNTSTITGLTADQVYYVYIQAEDVDGNELGTGPIETTSTLAA